MEPGRVDAPLSPPGERDGSSLEAAKMFAEFGQLLASQDDSATALERLPELALRSVPAAAAASVTTLRRGEFSTVACTDERARAADTVQYELSSGPCVDAILHDTIYRPEDLRRDTRWPVFGPRVAAEYGYSSMLSFRLQVSEIVAGVSIYAEPAQAFDDHDVQVGMLLATHGGIALSRVANRDRAGNLDRALQTSRDIGVAIGILMTRHMIPRQQAFELLRITSQRLNRKINELAVEVIETGALPQPGPQVADAPAERATARGRFPRGRSSPRGFGPPGGERDARADQPAGQPGLLDRGQDRIAGLERAGDEHDKAGPFGQ
jgi:hypothetical protein